MELKGRVGGAEFDAIKWWRIKLKLMVSPQAISYKDLGS